ncbi:MAG: PEP-CTERM sorting domain-containing protein [Phycisphaeraceae bacterium]
MTCLNISRSITLAIAIGAAGLLAAPAQALTITTAEGLGADAFVQGSPNNQNFGNTGTIVLKNGPTADNFARKGYVRFDLASTNGVALAEAMLSFTVATNNTPNTFTVEVLGLDDGHAGEFWVEGNGGADDNPVNEITWANAPANNTGSGINLINADVTSLGTITILSTDVPGTVVSLSSAALLSFLNADTNGVATLVLRRIGTNAGGSPNLVFHSHESTTGGAPTLALTVVPEPATAMLGLVGAAGLARRRRPLA